MLKRKSILSIALAMLLVVLVGCGQKETATQLADGGVLCLSVNPEIAVHYDGDGNVTKVEGRNDDGTAIVTDYTGYEGKPTREVVSELITEIGEAGYFVEEVEGARRQITIEIEAGSNLPSPTFLDEIVTDAKANVNSHQWQTPLDVLGESDYGLTNYEDTDYGPNNDGVTDYNDTDYGPNNDGVTDYNDTDYGPNNDGVTDYNDTDYGPNNDGVTDYNDTDYGPNNDGVTDYNASDYGSDDGASNYDDGSSNYDDGSSAYD